MQLRAKNAANRHEAVSFYDQFLVNFGGMREGGFQIKCLRLYERVSASSSVIPTYNHPSFLLFSSNVSLIFHEVKTNNELNAVDGFSFCQLLSNNQLVLNPPVIAPI